MVGRDHRRSPARKVERPGRTGRRGGCGALVVGESDGGDLGEDVVDDGLGDDDGAVTVGDAQILGVHPLPSDLDGDAVPAPLDPALVHGLHDPADQIGIAFCSSVWSESRVPPLVRTPRAPSAAQIIESMDTTAGVGVLQVSTTRKVCSSIWSPRSLSKTLPYQYSQRSAENP